MTLTPGHYTSRTEGTGTRKKAAMKANKQLDSQKKPAC